MDPNQKITDLLALKRAIERSGLKFHEGQTSFKYWAGNTSDCLHAITLQNGRQAGVVAAEEPGTYTLAMDSMDTRRLGDVFMYYQMEAARLEAQKQGDTYSEEEQEDGSYVVQIDTTGRMGQ
jgi:hypothetical protein